MTLKSFFADSVEEAIRLARLEIGPDAILVHSKQSGAEARHLGAYEVVCATESNPANPPPQPSPRPAQTPPLDKLVSEVSDLRQHMERLSRSLARCGGMAGIASDPELAAVFAMLNDAEMDPDLACDLVSRLSVPLGPGTVRSQMHQLVRVRSELGHPDCPQKIAALVGPPGAGKTSSLVKLAIQFGICQHKRVHFITLDTYRMAAAEELQSYAAILGSTFQIVENIGALTGALNEAHQPDLILIDTPGLSRHDMDESFAQAFAAERSIDTHLVLPASMRGTDLKRAAEQYSVFKPGKLLFTRLDETEVYGAMLSLSVRMGIPFSFLSNGQRVPEDMVPASSDLLLAFIDDIPSSSVRAGMVAA